ncbi:hypothetical protein [Streptomyces lydicus]|uniref:hypothetical protein n=1 Tax=Streptomyces lydicus TaxID=47763 RepID=UPI0037A9D91D
MSDRIRVRQPLLPTLVAHVEGRYEHLTGLLKEARAVELGETFEHDGHSYRRTDSDRDRTWAKSQDEPPVRVTDEDGQVLNVTLTEDTAFWEWAGLEILRHSGIRVEELCELTHLSIRQYRRPNDEVIALLVVAPSKSERERVIPMSADLFHAVAQIIRRLTPDGRPVRLLNRYDPHEKTWSEPMPFLMQRQNGTQRSVISPTAFLHMFARSCEELAEAHRAFADMTLTPHDLGYRPAVVSGCGEDGWAKGAPYARVFVSFALPRVPEALVSQLAPGGRLLVHITTASPSWPALAVVSRDPEGRIVAQLRAVESAHRAGHGRKQLFLSRQLRERIETRHTDGAEVRLFCSSTVPPPEEARGFWLALDALHPDLVRHRGVDDLAIGAPDCGSWMVAHPDGTGTWEVTASGPRDIWAEIHETALRWRAAGEPESYRLDLEPDGEQRVSAGRRPGALTWRLPAPDTEAEEAAR